jgi:uncharacterized protein (DUF4415 family)
MNKQAGRPAKRVPKKMVCIRLDDDLLDWYKRNGAGYQTWIRQVLREYKDKKKHRGDKGVR